MAGAFYVATGGGAVWAGTDNGDLVRIDPVTNSVTGLVHATADRTPCRGSDSGPACVSGIVYALGSVWVDAGYGSSDHAVIRISPE